MVIAIIDAKFHVGFDFEVKKYFVYELKRKTRLKYSVGGFKKKLPNLNPAIFPKFDLFGFFRNKV